MAAIIVSHWLKCIALVEPIHLNTVTGGQLMSDLVCKTCCADITSVYSRSEQPHSQVDIEAAIIERWRN